MRIEDKVPKGQTREARRLIRIREEEERLLEQNSARLDDDWGEPDLFNERDDE